MSAFGTSTPPTTRPLGACQNRGRCPHPRFAATAGAGDAYGLTPCTPTTERWVAAPTSKGQAATRLLRKP